MKLKFLLLLALVFGELGIPLFGQGTAFVYQGRLNVGGEPASASYDLTFSLFTNATGTAQVGSTVTNLAVGVTNGLFTTTVDFGQGIFTGASRWLEIGVRSNGSAGAFTEISSLQPITAAPYAILANGASNLLGTVPEGSLSGTYSNALTLNNPANNLTGNGAGVANVNAAQLGGVPASGFWQTTGNSGTSPTSGNYLGTTDNNPLELHVNGARALRLEPGSTPNVIGGASANSVTSGATGATIAGGGPTNRVTSSGGTVGGGVNNIVSNLYGTVSGGTTNVAAGAESTVGGGSGNTAGEAYSAVGGGQSNVVLAGADHSAIAGGEGNIIQANGFAAAIGGGNNNTNNGNAGTIAGGQNNIAYGAYQPAIGGGYGNVTSNWYATISGGIQNTNLGYVGTIGGGQANFAGNFDQPTVGGGYNNQANNAYATVPGGYQNIASGQNSFAAGQQAQALHLGTFVWADSQPGAFSSTTSNEFLIRAQGGVGINTSNPNGASLYVIGSRSNGFANSMSFFENTNTVSNTSPALRVLVDGGTPMDGALSVSANIAPTTVGLIAEFGNRQAFVTVISNDGTIYAPGFVGNGSGLTGVTNASTLGTNEIQTGTGLDGVAIETNLYLTAHPLYLRGDNGIDHNHGLAYCGSGVTNFPNTNVAPDGPVLWGFSGGVLGVLNGGAQAILSWNNTGVTITGTLTASNLSGSGSFAWQNDLSPSVQALPNNGYLVSPLNSFATPAVNLPTSPNVGDIIRVTCGNSEGWKITQNSGQVITGSFANGTSTTSGTTGYLTAFQYCAIELQYVGSGTFVPLNQEGSIAVH